MANMGYTDWTKQLEKSPYWGLASASGQTNGTDWTAQLMQSPYWGIADTSSAKPTEDLTGARIANAVTSGAHAVAIPGAGQYRGGIGSAEGRLDTYNLLDYLTDDQKSTIKGFADKGDYAAIRKYYDAIQPDLTAFRAVAREEQSRQFGQKHPVLSAFTEGLLNAVNWKPYTITAGTAVRNKITGEDNTVDTNDPAFDLSRAATAQNQGAAERIETGLSDRPALRTTARIARGGLSSAVTNMTQYALSEMLGIPPQVGILGLMGLSAASNTSYEKLREGQDAGRAAANATASGAIETATEIWSAGEWTKFLKGLKTNGAAVTAKDMAKFFAKHALEEGSEEIAGNVADQVWDRLYNGKDSDYEKLVRQLMENGETEEDARQKAFTQLYVIQSAEAAASAAFSVLFMDGAPVAMNQFSLANAGKQIRTGTDAETNVRNEIEKGKLFPEDNPAHQQAVKAEQAQQAGKLSDRDLGQLAQANGAATAEVIMNLLDSDSADVRSAAEVILRQAQTASEAASADKVPLPVLQKLLDLQTNGTTSATYGESMWADILSQLNGLDMDTDGQPLVTWQEAQEAIRTAYPDASEQEVRSIYRQYRNDTRTVLFGGHRLTAQQFRTFMQENTTQTLTASQLDSLFHAAVLDTLDGTDALERYLPAEQAADQAETATLQGDEQTAPVAPGLDVTDTVTAEAIKTLDAETVDRIHTLGERLGKRITFASEVEGGAAYGQISGNNIVLDRVLAEQDANNADNDTDNGEKLIWKILGHELTHGIQQDAPDAYAAFRDAVSQEERVQQEARNIQNLYAMRGQTVSDAYALDEAVANYGGEVIRDTDAAERFIERNRQDRTLLQRIRDAIVKLIRKLTGAEKRQAQTVQGLFDAALDAAAQNVRENVRQETGEGTQSGTESNPRAALKGTENPEKLEQLVRRNRELEEEVKRWKREASPANAKRRVVQGEVSRITDEFLKNWESTLSTRDLTSDVSHLWNLLQAGPEIEAGKKTASEAAYNAWTTEVENQSREIALRVVESIAGEDENEEIRNLRQFRKELRGAGISYDDLKGMGDFQIWRRRNQFRMGLKKDGQSVDAFWRGWAERYGEAFFPSDIDSPADMLLHIESLLDSTNAETVSLLDRFDTMEIVEECKNNLLDAIIAASDTQDVATRVSIDANERQAVRESAYRKGVQHERERTAENLKRARDRVREAVRAERQRGEQKLEAYKQREAERRKAREEAAESRKTWTQLNRLAKRLNNRKMRQADRAMLNSIYQEIDAIANATIGSSASEVYANMRLLWARIDETSELYDEAFVRNPRYHTVTGQIGLAETLQEQKQSPEQMESIEEQTAALNVHQLGRVIEFLQAFDHAQRTIDEMIRATDRRNLDAQRDNAIEHITEAEGFAHGIITEMLRPITFARRATGWAENDSLVHAIEDLSSGERARDSYKQQAENELLSRFAVGLGYAPAKIRNMSRAERRQVVRRIRTILQSFGGKEGAREENLIEIHGTDASAPPLSQKKITAHITKGMRAALYMHSLNEDNMRHVTQGGVTVPNLEQGGYDAYRKGDYKEAYMKGAVRIRLTEAQVQQIVSGMTAEERAFAEALAWYYDYMSKPRLAEVHEALKGWSPFNVEHYFPIETDSMFTRTDYETMREDGTLTTPGFSMERVKAGNPILLRDINLTAFDSIEQHSRFVGLAIPVRNINKLLNRSGAVFGDPLDAVSMRYGEEAYQKVRDAMQKQRNSGTAEKDINIHAAVRDALGKTKAEELWEFIRRNGQYKGVKAAIGDVFGEAGTGYIEKLMRDMTGRGKPASSISRIFSRLTSNYAQAALTLSGSVAPVQTASYPTAAAVLGWAPLAKALWQKITSPVTGYHVDLKVINAYTSRLWERSQGFTTHEADTLTGEETGLPKGLNWIQAMDVFTTTRLWAASEFYVDAENVQRVKDGLEPLEKGNRQEILAGQSAYYQRVAEIYNQVIEETQPSYGTMERPQILRSDNDLIRATNMFKTQMYQNFNILYDALGERGARARENTAAQTPESAAALQAAKAKVANAVTSQLTAALMAAVIKFAWNIFRRKDDKYRDKEGKLTAASVTKGIALGTVGTMAGTVAYGSELYTGLATLTDSVLKSLDADPFFNETFYGVNAAMFDAATTSVQRTGSALAAITGAAKIALTAYEDEEERKEVNWQDVTQKVLKAGTDLAQFTGFPARNVENILWGVVQWGVLAAMNLTGHGSAIGEYTLLHLTDNPEQDKKAYYDLLFRTGGRNFYPIPDEKAKTRKSASVPEEYRNLYQRMEDDGFDTDEMQSAMKMRYKRTKAYQAAYNQSYKDLAASVRKLSGYGKLDADKKEKLSDAVKSAAQYEAFALLVPGYQPSDSEGWIVKADTLRGKWKIPTADLLLLRAATRGMEGIPEEGKEKSIANSKGLKIMEAAYKAAPQMKSWPEDKRKAVFAWLGAGDKIVALDADAVQKQLAAMREKAKK